MDALWSDRFFNDSGAEKAFAEAEREQAEEKLTAYATEWLRINTDCPYGAVELAKDFIERV